MERSEVYASRMILLLAPVSASGLISFLLELMGLEAVKITPASHHHHY
jgi:hypothetical protein